MIEAARVGEQGDVAERKFVYRGSAFAMRSSAGVGTTPPNVPARRSCCRPCLGDFVPGYRASGSFGFGAPRNTSADIVDFAKLIADEAEKWGRVVKFAGLTAD